MIISFEKCYICGEISHFAIEAGATLLREATCEFCNSSLRNSDTAKILVKSLLHKDAALEECINELQKFKILEAQASGSINRVLKNSLNYTCFEYFDDIEPGQMNGEILCNNLEALTFDDNTFDVIISQDVLEHVINPIKSFSEIKRVLKNGGKHIFTVPLHQGRNTLCRSNLPSVFHGDPIRESGALVQFDWGDDIIDIINKQGMDTIVHQLHIFYSNDDLTNVDLSYSEYLKTPPLMYYRYNSIVFESTKNASKINSFDNYSKNASNHTSINTSTIVDNASSLQLLKFGPEDIIAEESFNIQLNGKNALWCETQNAKKTTSLILNNFKLESEVNDDGTLITATIPSWLFRFPGEYPIYLCDNIAKEKSNELNFIVKPQINNLDQKDTEKNKLEIKNLRTEIIDLYKELEEYKQQKPYRFSGWEMLTRHDVPWHDNYNWELFRDTCDKIKETFEFGLYNDIGIDSRNVDSLRWRHWIVAFAINYAIKFKNHSGKMNLVECGVGDGMSALFTLKEIRNYVEINSNEDYSMHLYDSWDTLSDSALTTKETYIKGRYVGNSFERTQRNLKEFDSNITYHKGYIPDSLFSPPVVDERIDYLHIDLNSATATLAALEFFYNKMENGSVILFDDYGWEGFEDTKESVDKFFSKEKGILLKIPTGQAIFFVL